MPSHFPELLLRVLTLQSLLWLLVPTVLADNHTNPISIFHSVSNEFLLGDGVSYCAVLADSEEPQRPDLKAPILTIINQTPELVTPGYIFIAPYQAYQEGPYIYDNDGNLVWTGFGVSGPWAAHAVHVCDYLGSKADHLCFFQGFQLEGYARGHGIIMDNNYRIVRSVEPGGATLSSDMHEFYVLPGGRSALLTVYKQLPYDLSAYGIDNGVAYIQEGIFQEINIETGEVMFDWRSLDHIDPAESFVPPGSTSVSGTALNKEDPWDYFHINSIDKNAAGDYLISARHVSCVYKISGKDGSILWRLQGKHSTFQLTNFHFSSQHDARWLSENKTHTVMSMFDNASDGYNRTKSFSQGLIIAIDHVANTATAIREYNAPDENGGLESKSQGNTQVLANGNVFQGWGSQAFLSEHTEDGTGVWYGWIALTGTMNYRSYKFNWTSTPNSAPSMWTYSKTGAKEDGMVFYVSWNGATEVKEWRFYGAQSKQGPYSLLVSTPKRGFETTIRHDVFSPYSYVEALDGAGKVLRQGEKLRTFIPGADIVVSCNEFWCNDAKQLSDEEKKKKKEDDANRKAEEDEERERQDEELRRKKEEAKAREKTRKSWWYFGIAMVTVMLLVIVATTFRKPLSGVARSSLKTAMDYLSRLESQVRRGRYSTVAGDEPWIPR